METILFQSVTCHEWSSRTLGLINYYIVFSTTDETINSKLVFLLVEAAEDKQKAIPEESKELFSLSERKEQLSPDAKEPHYKNIVHLWEYLLELLAEDSCRSLISWSNKERMEFKLKNPSEVAKRWGLMKRKKGMNYEKLSRALRYYYQQGIVKKVSWLLRTTN